MTIPFSLKKFVWPQACCPSFYRTNQPACFDFQVCKESWGTGQTLLCVHSLSPGYGLPETCPEWQGAPDEIEAEDNDAPWNHKSSHNENSRHHSWYLLHQLPYQRMTHHDGISIKSAPKPWRTGSRMDSDYAVRLHANLLWAMRIIAALRIMVTKLWWTFCSWEHGFICRKYFCDILFNSQAYAIATIKIMFGALRNISAVVAIC